MQWSFNSIEYTLLISFLFILSVGPWTIGAAQMMSLSVYETKSVVDMSWFMFKKIPLSFLYGFPYFIGVPVLFLLFRYFFDRYADIVQLTLIYFSKIVSICTIPLLFVRYDSIRSTSNIMGEVFTADLITMFVIHAILCIQTNLPSSSIAGGPLFGLAVYLRRDAGERISSLLGGVVALYLNVGALYTGYIKSESLGLQVFSQTLLFSEWFGYELYACVTVVLGFVLICASVPIPKSFVDLAETIAYLVLLNANVGAAWIASKGVVRRALRSPTPIVIQFK